MSRCWVAHACRCRSVESECDAPVETRVRPVLPETLRRPFSSKFSRRGMTHGSSFADRTMVVSGGSRGIGLAIALGAARHGANVVLLAKTAEPHPKLPGTVHTAVADVEAAGGKG